MVELINRKDNIFGDDIAFVEQYDFSRANLNESNRITAITTVASICYQNPKGIGSESLYNRLLAESKGLPSSSFEMCPMLFTQKEITELYFSRNIFVSQNNPLTKFGEWVEDGKYLLTNFRAITYFFEETKIDLRYRFNTEEECKIIAKHFKVFLFKVDLPTRSQMVRHRVNWQELSRRYVSGERVPFEFYISDKMKTLNTSTYPSTNITTGIDYAYPEEEEQGFDINWFLSCSIHLYQEALSLGIKPQEARRIIPQAAYTQIWGAFQPTQLENYFKLRLDSHAQWEIQQTAIAMKELIGE